MTDPANATETLSTLVILNSLVSETFGSIAFVRERWHVDKSDRNFPGRSYFSDRRKNHKTAPINRRCATYIERIYAPALMGRTDFDMFEVSQQLSRSLGRAAQADLSDCQMQPNSERKRRKRLVTIQMALLRALLELAIDSEAVDVGAFRNAVVNILTREGVPDMYKPAASLEAFDYELRFMSDSVAQANYGALIRGVTRELSICHVHGCRWMEVNQKHLEARLSEGNININVALMDPSSAYLRPYALLKGTGKSEDERIANMRDKIAEATARWLDLYDMAVKAGAENIFLRIVHHHQTPSAGLYLFDTTIIYTPTKNSSANTPFPAIECVRTDNPKGAYQSFKHEIDLLLQGGKPVTSKASFPNQGESAESCAAFLEGVLRACFGSTSPQLGGSPAVSSGDVIPSGFFEKRLREHADSPIDKATALSLEATISMALDNQTAHDPITASRNLVQFLKSAYGIQLDYLSTSPDDEDASVTAKNRILLDCIHYIILTGIDSRELSIKRAKQAIRASRRIISSS